MIAVVILSIVAFYAISKKQAEKRQRRKEVEQRRREAEQRERDRAMRQELREIAAKQAAEMKAREAIRKEQERLAREQERQAKEQERQAAQLAKHEERIMRLEQRMATAESELAFNREQRERLFSLLDIEERERDACIEGSSEWQKHQKKVISLENQVHTVQKRIDKAHMDKVYCEKQMKVA